MQAQHVLADPGDALHFVLCHRNQLPRLGVRANFLAEQKQNVAHRVERVVDFVRDGRRETTSESQAFVRL